MADFRSWLNAFRLRTLPLSLATIFVGSILAAYKGYFNSLIFALAVLTTLFLQILSNLANDYGDAVSGVDSQGRIGPERSIQAGLITKEQMKKAIIVFVVLSLCSGIALIFVGSKGILSYSLIFLALGIGAIVAAIKYTMGKNPYGYSGFGDFFVFLFFGLVAVMGLYFLYTHTFSILECLVAITMGCFSTGVLNLNNLRDRENDAAFGKNTIVVKIGEHKAKIYHAVLLSVGMLATIIYCILNAIDIWRWFFLLSYIGIVRSIVVVFKNKQPELLDPELKKLAISTLLFALLFGCTLLL